MPPQFRREDLTVDETFIDDDGAEYPMRVVEPEDVRFADETMTCIFADGHVVVVRREHVVELGLNPYTKMPVLVSSDGVSISLPEHIDTSTAVRWFKRGKAR